METAEINTETDRKGRNDTLPHVCKPRSTQLAGQTRSTAPNLQTTAWNLYQNAPCAFLYNFLNYGNLWEVLNYEYLEGERRETHGTQVSRERKGKN